MVSNAEIAELAERLPANFSGSLARSAFQIVSAACCRNRSRHRGAEVAEDGFERRARRARRASSWKFLGVLGALGVSDRLGGLLAEPFAAPRSGGRRGRFRTPSAPSSPSVFLEISRGPWRARRFRSSRRPLCGAIRGTAERRSPRTVSNAERAELAERLPGNFLASLARSAFQIVSASSLRSHSRHRGAEVAEDGFERRARRARRASSWKFLGVLGALGVSDRLGVLFAEPFAAPRSGGRRGRFRTPSAPSSPSVFLEISWRPWRARRFRSSRRPLCGAIRGTAERRSPRTVSNAERAELAERLPGNFSGSLARSAFQIVSASSFRSHSRHRGAEVAEDGFERRARRARRASSWKFLGVLCALGVSDRLGVLFAEPFAAPRSGGRRGRFRTPSAPSSPSVFLEISRGPWRARRFRSSRRPLCGAIRGTAERRSPRTVSNAERAELAERLPGNFSGSLARSAFQIVSASSLRSHSRHRGAEVAEDGFERRARRARRASSWKFLGVLCALGVSDRLGVLFAEPFAAPRSGGRRGRFRTPSAPSSPSVFLEISRGPWRARRFRSSRRPLCGAIRGTAERRSPRTVSNAERAELAERLPGNFSGSLARSAFQIVSASSLRSHSRHRGAEVAEDGFERRARRARRASSWKFLGVLCALGVSDRLGVLFAEPFAAPRSGGRRGRFRTPSAPSSPSVFLEISRGPWRARRFRSSRRPLCGAIRGTAERRSPRTVSNAERAELAERLPGNFLASLARSAFQIVSASSLRSHSRHRGAEVAEDGFERRARRARRASSWKFLGVLGALGVSDRLGVLFP